MKSRKIWRLVLIVTMVSLVVINNLAFSPKIREKDLPKKYQDFLDLVAYIILPEEKEVFLQLTTNRG